MYKTLVVATSRRTRGGITSVVKAHEQGKQWTDYNCKWIETHRDGSKARKFFYLVRALIQYTILLPFYDIIHIHLTLGSSGKRKLPFIRLAKNFNKKVIVHFHPSTEKILFEQENNKLGKKIFEMADLVLVLSPQWKDWINEAYPNNKFNMEVLYNPCPKVNRTNVERKKQILYAGTILKRKGYDILIQAFAKIAKNFPDWKIVFAGNPYYENGVNEIEHGNSLAEKHDITSQIEWLGWISGERKEEVFNQSSIYCLASDGEGFPMGVLDAWAYGIPCVMTPVGGIPDIVRDGIEGLMFPVGDVDTLSKKLEIMISNEELRINIVKATDVYVNQTFEMQEINRQLGNIYSTLSKSTQNKNNAN